MKQNGLRCILAGVVLATCFSAVQADLVLHYTYDGVANGSTDPMPDVSGNGADGIRSGGLSWTMATDPDRGEVLNNTSSIAITKGTLNSTNNEATIASWYKGTDTAGYFFDQKESRFICGFGQNSGELDVWLNGTWYKSGVLTSSVADDAWHHVAYVWGNNGTDATVQIYVDGAAIDWGGGETTKTLTGKGMMSLTGTTEWQRIFSSYNGTSQLNGLVDDTRIYDTALSAGEIANLASVPEPATMSLLAMGGVALLRRRRK